MKNLAHIDTEKLEQLPKRYKTLRDGSYSYWYGSFPWQHVNRFLQSRVGDNWDDIVSAYTKFDWIPVEYRNYHKLADTVETHTFMKDGEVWYFRNWYCENYRPMDHETSTMFYVHPETKKLCQHIPKSRKTRHEEYLAKQPTEFVILPAHQQLRKIDGIWYRFWLSEDPDKMECGKYRTVNYTRPFDSYDIKDYQLKIGEEKRYSKENEEYSYAVRYRMIPAPKLLRKQLNSKELKRYFLKNDTKPIKYGRLKN